MVGGCLSLSLGSSCNGVNFLRNFLFRKVIRLLPSILTLYCLLGNTCTTTPLLDQRRGWLPV